MNVHSSVRIAIDPSRSVGPVKPVNGVGQPPITSATSFPMFRYLREAGIPFSRLHDTGGMFGRGIFVDIPNLFRDFDTDETDPENYDFAFTDLLASALVEAKVEPFFRLGVTIENYPFVKRYRIEPPTDFAKWARICEHVIRHYTEGWAGGFNYKITHWEIWNEPENWPDPERNEMWHGTFGEYCRLYDTASKHLKAAFPHLKIGGYASCGVGAAAEREDWHPDARLRHHLACFHEFLAFVREHGCPLDFFSYHTYAGISDIPFQIAYVREHLDRAGFAHVPTCLDEWLPAPSHEKLGTAQQASEIAATLLMFQNGPVDSAAIYDARCGVGNYSPLFNPLTYEPHKAYYAFLAFNELRRRGTALEVEISNTETQRHGESGTEQLPLSAPSRLFGDKMFTAAARDEDGSLAVMLANPGMEVIPFEITVADGGRMPTRCRIVDGERTWEQCPLPSSLPGFSTLLVEYGKRRL